MCTVPLRAGNTARPHAVQTLLQVACIDLHSLSSHYFHPLLHMHDGISRSFLRSREIMRWKLGSVELT